MSVPASQAPDPAPGRVAGAAGVVAGVTLSVVSIATFLLLPQFIEAVVSDLGYSERAAGLLSAVLNVGSTGASVLASVWIRRSSWQRLASWALAGMLAAYGASMASHAIVAFIALEGVIGFCGGSVYSLALTVLSDTRHPDRYFAYAVGAQTVYQIVGLVAGPFLIHHGGANAFLTSFAALAALGLAFVRRIPAHGRVARDAPRPAGLLSLPVGFALAGCFLFNANVGAYWTYIERIGTLAGLGLSEVSNALAFTTATSMAGSFIAVWLGARRGYLAPIAASAAAVVVAIVLLMGSFGLAAFIVSGAVYGIAWNVSLTYQYSLVNRVDQSRRGVALTPALHWAGAAAGPALAALVVTQTDHSGVLWLANLSVLASLACFAIAQRLHARRAAREPAAAAIRSQS